MHKEVQNGWIEWDGDKYIVHTKKKIVAQRKKRSEMQMYSHCQRFID
jgi:hypothetical protein